MIEIIDLTQIEIWKRYVMAICVSVAGNEYKIRYKDGKMDEEMAACFEIPGRIQQVIQDAVILSLVAYKQSLIFERDNLVPGDDHDGERRRAIDDELVKIDDAVRRMEEKK